MDKDRRRMTERILSLTLEIIYLLTGEDYVPARKSCDYVKVSSDPHVPGKVSQTKSPITAFPHPSRIDELKNDVKILDLTNKILELLTGEVPLRHEDIIVCFTMEEWEYVEGHKECYMDVIKEDKDSLVGTDKPQLHVTENDGDDDEIIIPDHQNTCKSTESMALDLLNHFKRTTTNSMAETNAKQITYESTLMKEESTMDDEKLLTKSETYVASQSLVSKYSSQTEESVSSEDHYEDSCAFPPAEQDDCEYLYITEDGNTHVSRNRLTIMTCSDCGDRFTVETDDACFERLQPYRCRKCSSCTLGTDVREGATVGVAEISRTSNLLYEDYEKGNVDRKKIFASRKHLDSKKMNRRKKPCSYPKWGGYSEDNVSLNSYNIVPEEKVFTCSHCSKGFNHQTSLELHQKTHIVEKASFISQSGKHLRNKALLKTHQLVHTGGKQYNCSECGKTFKRSLSLAEHMQLHTGEKTFTCPDCGQGFTQRSAYITHHKVHKAGKLNSCFECGKSFRTKADLTTHQRIHMGETPFPCPECGESFTRRANLVRHQRIHTGEKPFSCPDCGKRFTRKLGLMKHQKIHSGENVYKRGYRKNAFSMYRVIV